MSCQRERKILKCNVCGLVIETFCSDVPSIPHCCGEKMELVEAKSSDEGKEKHVPAGEIAPDGHLLVKVGKETEHPMTNEHHICWIEWCYENRCGRVYLDHTDKSQGHFCVKPVKGMKLREYCNIHGLWEGEFK